MWFYDNLSFSIFMFAMEILTIYSCGLLHQDAGEQAHSNNTLKNPDA